MQRFNGKAISHLCLNIRTCLLAFNTLRTSNLTFTINFMILDLSSVNHFLRPLTKRINDRIQTMKQFQQTNEMTHYFESHR